jgi:hypothetical protein
MLKYIDGNNNRFTIDAAKVITYNPITPIESSSGMYSGGDPWTRTLSDAEYTQLVALFDAAFVNADGERDPEHGRPMGTGLVERTTDTGKESAILIKTKSALETALKRLK